MPRPFFLLTLGVFLLPPAFVPAAFAQPTRPESDVVRVNVTINPDGSRTVYKFDSANHKATATTTEPDGKPRGKIDYELDEAGRFASGQVFGPDGQFRFRTLYKYDAAGRMLEEQQLGKDNVLSSRIVYSYDKGGKQTGYSIYNAAGKLIGRFESPNASPPPAGKHGRSKTRP